jgi:MraZ protein
MLIGSYLGVLGDKRRVAVPKKFLAALGGNPVLAKWYEGCLVLVSASFWESLLSRLTGGSKVISLGARDIERFILGSAFETEPDAQGRIIIPELLAEYSGVIKDLVFVGLGDRVEVWPKEVWDKKSQDLATTTKEYIEQIAENERR